MLILWDRDCGFCAWGLAGLLRADRRGLLRTAPIQSAEGDRWLAGMPAERRLASWHVVDEDGALHSGGAAVTVVLRRLPAGRSLGALTGRAPGLTERAYAWVARHRSMLSRPIPDGWKQRARTRVEARSAES